MRIEKNFTALSLFCLLSFLCCIVLSFNQQKEREKWSFLHSLQMLFSSTGEWGKDFHFSIAVFVLIFYFISFTVKWNRRVEIFHQPPNNFEEETIEKNLLFISWWESWKLFLIEKTSKSQYDNPMKWKKKWSANCIEAKVFFQLLT